MLFIVLRNIELSITKKVYTGFKIKMNWTWEVFENIMNIIMMTQAGYTNGYGRALSRLVFL